MSRARRLPGLDRLIYEPIRLGIVSALAVNPSLTFNELKKLLETTDGNLSVHARKLEDAQYIVCSKSFEGRMPKTQYRLTETGRRALEKYLNHMEALIQPFGNGRPLFLEYILYAAKHFGPLARRHHHGRKRPLGSARGLPRVAGHRAGAEALRRTVEAAPDLGIGVLTVYAFSSDNWRAPAARSVRADEDVPHLPAPRAGQVRG